MSESAVRTPALQTLAAAMGCEGLLVGRQEIRCPLSGFAVAFGFMMDLSSNGCAAEGEHRQAPCLKRGEPINWLTCSFIGKDTAEKLLAEQGTIIRVFPGKMTGETGITLQQWNDLLMSQDG